MEEAALLCPHPSPSRRGLSQTDLVFQSPRVPGSRERNTALLKTENQVALVTRKAGMSNAGARKEGQTWLCEIGRWPACCFRENPWAGF